MATKPAAPITTPSTEDEAALRRALRDSVQWAYITARAEENAKRLPDEPSPSAEDKKANAAIRSDWKEKSTRDRFAEEQNKRDLALESALGNTDKAPELVPGIKNSRSNNQQVIINSTVRDLLRTKPDISPADLYDAALDKAYLTLALPKPEKTADSMEASENEKWAKWLKEQTDLKHMAKAQALANGADGKPGDLFGAMTGLNYVPPPPHETNVANLRGNAAKFCDKAIGDGLLHWKGAEADRKKYALGLLYESFATNTTGYDVANGAGSAFMNTIPPAARGLLAAVKNGNDKIDWSNPEWAQAKEALVAAGITVKDTANEIIQNLPIKISQDIRVGNCNQFWEAIRYPGVNDPLKNRELTAEQLSSMPEGMEEDVRREFGISKEHKLTMRNMVEYLGPEFRKLATMTTGSHNRSKGQDGQEAFTWDYLEYSYWGSIGGKREYVTSDYMKSVARETVGGNHHQYRGDEARQLEKQANDKTNWLGQLKNTGVALDPDSRSDRSDTPLSTPPYRRERMTESPGGPGTG